VPAWGVRREGGRNATPFSSLVDAVPARPPRWHGRAADPWCLQGVPKFYRWLSERYPLVNQAIDDATLLPIFDNLYLDLNGVIHGATHGDGATKVVTDEEVMHKMFAYIDMMVKITRPRKLIYFAVDGVAPRAKMNQQRSRRFRAARDAATERQRAIDAGEVAEDEELFDSNQITPGTPFMARVSEQLKYYIRRRLRDDPAWRDLRIIYSGHDVPGEGEHKIVTWIRAAKMLPDWDPNTRHVMAGLDADLVMLSLATHEPHFSLLREQVDFMANRRSAHDTHKSTRTAKQVKWQLLHIGLLREYLEMDMRPSPTALSSMKFPWDGERCIDDFILLTALCGNDFIPHLPSVDIGEGAMDHLLELYRKVLPAQTGWLTDKGKIHFDRLNPLLVAMGAMEEQVMSEREDNAVKRIKNKKSDEARRMRLFGTPKTTSTSDDAGMEMHMSAFLEEESDTSDSEEGGASWLIAGSTGVTTKMRHGAVADAIVDGAASAGLDLAAEPDAEYTGKAAAAAMASLRMSGITDDVVPESDAERSARAESTPRVSAAAADSLASDTRDVIAKVARSVSSLTHRQRYYFAKFGLVIDHSPAIEAHEMVLEKIRRCFGEALQWVMLYYYQGCPSWEWFFPFHYAPMISDLVDIGDLGPFEFALGKPFAPFQQLLGCLPAASSKFLPEPYRWLMTSVSSPLQEFYPPLTSIRIDKEPHHAPWEGTVIIPFIREEKLLRAVIEFAPDSRLTEEERFRNDFGRELLIFRDPKCADTLVSPIIKGRTSKMTADFPDIAISRTRVTPHDPPKLESDFIPRPRAGCVIPAPGYPTLHTLFLTPVRTKLGIRVFGSASRKESVVMAVTPQGREADYVREKLNPPEREHEHLLLSEGDDSVVPYSVRGRGSLVAHTPSFSVRYTEGTCVKPPPEAAASLARALSEGSTDQPDDVGPLSLNAGRATALEASELIGHVVYVGWPHLSAAYVLSVSDETMEVTIRSPKTRELVHKRWGAEESMLWRSMAEAYHRTHLSGDSESTLTQCGIGAGVPTLMVRALKLTGMRRDPTTGALERTWASPGTAGDIRVPGQLLLAEHPNPDPRFVELPPSAAAERFAAGSVGVILHGPHAGETGIVVGATEKSLSVAIPSGIPKEPNFIKGISPTFQEAYIPSFKVAKELGVSGGVLGRMSSSIKVGGRQDGIDIGLNMRVWGDDKREVYVPGLVRPRSESARSVMWSKDSMSKVKDGASSESGGWEYTAAAVDVMRAFISKFPRVIAALEADPGRKALEVGDFGGPAELVRVLNWKGQLEFAKRPRVPLGTQVMSKVGVAVLERTANKVGEARSIAVKQLVDAAEEAVGGHDVLGALKASGLAFEVIDGIKPADLFCREAEGYAVGGVGGGEGMMTLPDGAPELGTRVCNLSDPRAPVGARGTVVTVHGTGNVEVVWDVPVDGASSLFGMCSPGRGALVRWNALLPLAPGHHVHHTPAVVAASGSAASVRPRKQQAAPVNVASGPATGGFSRPAAVRDAKAVDMQAHMEALKAKAPAATDKAPAAASSGGNEEEPPAAASSGGIEEEPPAAASITERPHFMRLLQSLGPVPAPPVPSMMMGRPVLPSAAMGFMPMHPGLVPPHPMMHPAVPQPPPSDLADKKGWDTPPSTAPGKGSIEEQLASKVAAVSHPKKKNKQRHREPVEAPPASAAGSDDTKPSATGPDDAKPSRPLGGLTPAAVRLGKKRPAK
jgi:5'-3' exonuclease